MPGSNGGQKPGKAPQTAEWRRSGGDDHGWRGLHVRRLHLTDAYQQLKSEPEYRSPGDDLTEGNGVLHLCTIVHRIRFNELRMGSQQSQIKQ
jgi:hypothetical protein